MDGSTYGIPVQRFVDEAGIHPDTARRWKRQDRIPNCRRALVELGLKGELGALDPRWQGYVLRDGLIWTPENYSVTHGELRAIPYRRDLIEELKRMLREPKQWELFQRPADE